MHISISSNFVLQIEQKKEEGILLSWRDKCECSEWKSVPTTKYCLLCNSMSFLCLSFREQNSQCFAFSLKTRITSNTKNVSHFCRHCLIQFGSMTTTFMLQRENNTLKDLTIVPKVCKREQSNLSPNKYLSFVLLNRSEKSDAFSIQGKLAPKWPL